MVKRSDGSAFGPAGSDRAAEPPTGTIECPAVRHRFRVASRATYRQRWDETFALYFKCSLGYRRRVFHSNTEENAKRADNPKRRVGNEVGASMIDREKDTTFACQERASTRIACYPQSGRIASERESFLKIDQRRAGVLPI
jgi:hypothetical protein